MREYFKLRKKAVFVAKIGAASNLLRNVRKYENINSCLEDIAYFMDENVDEKELQELEFDSRKIVKYIELRSKIQNLETANEAKRILNEIERLYEEMRDELPLYMVCVNVIDRLPNLYFTVGECMLFICVCVLSICLTLFC